MRAIAFASALAIGMISPAAAQTLTNDMACAKVQRIYAETGRVMTRSRSGAVLPIYGGVPWLVRKTFFCGPNRVQAKTFVIAKDDRTCVVASRCI